MTIAHVLIVEDDDVLGALLAKKFAALGWQVTRAVSIASVRALMERSSPFSHAVLDLNLANQSGLRLIPDLLAHSEGCKIVVLTGYASVQTTIEAIKLGAIYLLSKPSGVQDILNAFGHLPDPEHVRLDDHAKSGIAQHSWETIQQALRDNEFNVSKTAAQLGMHRRTLQRKLKKPI
jgi:two-component system response regulator RegA